MDSVVKTRHGEVRGSLINGVHTFKGIPYAAPPFGANRLRPPQPVTPWRGVRDALTYGPKTPQVPYPRGFEVILADVAGAGEDCLNLNVWSATPGAARQPVMVWIPGGAFEFGTAAVPYNDGSRFARDGIVCVTINYRVGADGFLCLDEGVANCGLLDQVAAFTWVQENIAAFGGDPGNVTVFGQSAGAMSIGSLLSMPRAHGLFRRAILQSGAAHPVMSAATAKRVGQHLAASLGTAATREAIAAVPVDRLIQAQLELRADLAAHPDPGRWGEEAVINMMPWMPVIDGDVIPARPIDRIAAGAGADIDILVGTTSDEWRFFLVPNGVIEHITQDVLTRAVAAYGLPVEATLEMYRSVHPNARPGDLLAAIQTDWYIRMPATRLASAHAQNAKGSSTYMYEFAWRSPQFNGLLGACHGGEMPFIFDTLGSGTELMWGSNPPQHLADTIHAEWVALPATVPAVGRSTISPEGRRCASTSDPRSWTILDPRSGHFGKACVFPDPIFFEDARIDEEVMMSNSRMRRFTGIFALATILLWLSIFPLYTFGPLGSLYDGAALAREFFRLRNVVFTRILLGMGIYVTMLVFAVGLRDLIRRADAEYEWVGTLAVAAMAVWGGVTLVGNGLEGGAALDALSGSGDPSVARALTMGYLLIYNGSIAFIMTALFMAAAGYATLATGILPRWTAWLAYAATVLCLLCIPAMYVGPVDPRRFYNAGGWGAAIIANFPPLLWFLVVGVLLIWKHQPVALTERAA